MRVTMLAASARLGGAERVVLECIHALTSRGIECTLLALEDGPLHERAMAAGARRTDAVPLPRGLATLGDALRSRGETVLRLMGSAPSLPTYMRRFRRALCDHGPDVIQSHGIKTHVLATLLPSPAPVVWHVHDYVGLRPASAALLTRLARRCRLAIAVSASVSDDMRSWLPGSTSVVVAHNAVDAERFAPGGSRLDLDRAAGLPAAAEGTLRVGLPATFARWKGHEVFLKAMAALDRDDVRGYVIGGPIYQTADGQWSEPELRQMVAELGLGQRVGLTGFIDDMPAAYRSLDVVVHASTQPEPFGLVVAEAMAAGRPVVTSGIGGTAEVFEDGVDAVRFRASDSTALAGTLDSLLADPARREALGRQARDRVKTRFGRDALARVLVPALTAIAAREKTFA